MKKNKVLFITRKYPPQTGGMENLCYHLAQNMPNDEFDVKVIALGKKQIHLFWFFPYVLLYILFQVRTYDFLLLGDGLMCLCGVLSRLVAPRVKVVTILHGLDVTFKNVLYQMYLKLFLKRSSTLFVCNSTYTKQTVEAWGITDGLTVITPGINIEGFSSDNMVSNEEFRKKYNIPEKNLVLLTVGRLIKRKGAEWFVLNVMPQLQSVTYLIVGEGPDKVKIMNAVEQNGLNDSVKLLGRISDEDWRTCYLNADVFIMPNIHIQGDVEGFGIVAAEASLAGLIVVASDVDGIPDAIQNGKNGILVTSGNEEAFVKTINEIKECFEVYTQKASEYSKYTREFYSWKHISDIYRRQMKSLK